MLPWSPEEAANLEPAFQGNTGNGATGDVGYRWLRKRYQFTAATAADGRLYVIIGVWGTYEISRTYFVDDVRVGFAAR